MATTAQNLFVMTYLKFLILISHSYIHVHFGLTIPPPQTLAYNDILDLSLLTEAYDAIDN